MYMKAIQKFNVEQGIMWKNCTKMNRRTEKKKNSLVLLILGSINKRVSFDAVIELHVYKGDFIGFLCVHKYITWKLNIDLLNLTYAVGKNGEKAGTLTVFEHWSFTLKQL